MGKLSFLLAEDYIKPRIYFNSKNKSSQAKFADEDTEKFIGLNHLLSVLESPNGFIINAFQVDYYQSLPHLILKKLQEVHSYKRLYVLGPELSLSILKRSAKSVYSQSFDNLEYLNIEYDVQNTIEFCIKLLKEGHIVYVLPETSVSWYHNHIIDFDFKITPLCSALLSQRSKTSILCSMPVEDSDQIELCEPNKSIDYSGSLYECVEHQSKSIYEYLHKDEI